MSHTVETPPSAPPRPSVEYIAAVLALRTALVCWPWFLFVAACVSIYAGQAQADVILRAEPYLIATLLTAIEVGLVTVCAPAIRRGLPASKLRWVAAIPLAFPFAVVAIPMLLAMIFFFFLIFIGPFFPVVGFSAIVVLRFGGPWITRPFMRYATPASSAPSPSAADAWWGIALRSALVITWLPFAIYATVVLWSSGFTKTISEFNVRTDVTGPALGGTLTLLWVGVAIATAGAPIVASLCMATASSSPKPRSLRLMTRLALICTPFIVCWFSVVVFAKAPGLLPAILVPYGLVAWFAGPWVARPELRRREANGSWTPAPRLPDAAATTPAVETAPVTTQFREPTTEPPYLATDARPPVTASSPPPLPTSARPIRASEAMWSIARRTALVFVVIPLVFDVAVNGANAFVHGLHTSASDRLTTFVTSCLLQAPAALLAGILAALISTPIVAWACAAVARYQPPAAVLRWTARAMIFAAWTVPFAIVLFVEMGNANKGYRGVEWNVPLLIAIAIGWTTTTTIAVLTGPWIVQKEVERLAALPAPTTPTAANVPAGMR